MGSCRPICPRVRRVETDIGFGGAGFTPICAAPQPAARDPVGRRSPQTREARGRRPIGWDAGGLRTGSPRLERLREDPRILRKSLLSKRLDHLLLDVPERPVSNVWRTASSLPVQTVCTGGTEGPTPVSWTWQRSAQLDRYVELGDVPHSGQRSRGSPRKSYPHLRQIGIP